MPSKNIIKLYAPKSYYHIYTRGVNKLPVFLSEKDYIVFVGLFKRYLETSASKNASRHVYPNYAADISLISYALMPNHIHLLIYQNNERDIANFMRSVLTSYAMYFNKAHKRIGPIFQSRYKASLIDDSVYLEHISRYIHMNPKDWKASNKTSLRYYLNQAQADWISPKNIMAMFNNDPKQYFDFLEDYEGQKNMQDEIKWELANDDTLL